MASLCALRRSVWLAFWFCLVTLSGQCGAASNVERPNIIVILADDFGWDDVSFHGSQQIPTPNLDALAYDGVILDNYYVQPICTPSRAALLTGKHPTQLGLQAGVPLSAEPYGLGLNETLLPQYLKKLGYTSRIVGKWHLGFFAKEYTPTYRGFDSFFGFYNGHGDYWDHTFLGGGRYWGLDLHRDDHGHLEMVKDKFGVYSTELFTQEAEKIIQNHDPTKPLFLYMPQQAVHAGNENTKTPLEAPWKYVKQFKNIANEQRRLYCAMVAALDDSVGNITRALHARGMLNNSIIVFSTDNGGPAAGFDKNHASNWPLRGMKYTQWEGGVRGAGFIWSPHLRQSGYVSRHRMQIEDLFPTLLRGAGYDVTTLPRDLYGKDFWDTLAHNGKDIRGEMLHNIDPRTATKALRVGDMKVLTAGSNSNTARLAGWYPPENVPLDTKGFTKSQSYYSPQDIVLSEELDLTYSSVNFSGLLGQSSDNEMKIEREPKFSPPSDLNSDEDLETERKPVDMCDTNLSDILRELGRGQHNRREPVIVKCGPKPVEAKYKCNVTQHPCLFNITLDPCEYRDIAGEHPQLVSELMARLKVYEEMAAPPRNKPLDPKGQPKYHNGMWVPWVKLSDKSEI